MSKTSTKTKAAAGASTPVNDNGSKRTARFALYDQHLARAKVFLLHGRGGASTKHANLDDMSDTEIARRTRSKDPKERLILPPVTIDVVEPRHDPSLCSPNGKLTLIVTSVYPVGVAEETLLLVLLSLAGKKRPEEDRKAGVISSTSPNRDLAVKSIGAKGDGPLGEKILAIHVSRRRLINELCLDGGGRGYEYIKARLRRLRWIGYDATLIEGNVERAWGGSQLLSYDMVEDDPDALIKINLNERFARVLIGANDTRKRAPYERIDLDERFALQTEAAKLLHMRISVDVPGQRGRNGTYGPASVTYDFDALADEIYPLPDKPLTESGIKKRRTAIRKAFEAIGALPGWMIEFKGTTAKVSRSERKRGLRRKVTP